MKALSLHQPWADLVARGLKTYETRSWATQHRGVVAIHATNSARHLGADADGVPNLRSFYGECYPLWRLPRGAIIGVMRVMDCWATSSVGVELWKVASQGGKLKDYARNQLDMGDWSDGRVAWGIVTLARFGKPIPCRGKQGLWDVPADVELAMLGDSWVPPSLQYPCLPPLDPIALAKDQH